MQYNRFRRYAIVAASAASLLFSAGHALATEPSEAAIMPKAHKSLLLDVSQQAGRIFVVGERGHILQSSDQGKTWQQKAVPTAKMLTAVYFVNEQSAWAVGHDGNIVASQDGGETWILQRDGLSAQKIRNEERLKHARAELKRLKRLQANGVEEEDGEDIDSLIDEAEWQRDSAQEDLHADTIAPPLMDVWFANDKQGFVAGAFGVFLSTNDGGKTWQDRTDEFAESVDGYHLNSVTGTKDGLVVLVGEAGYLAVSQDFGETWQQVELDTEATFFGVESNSDGSLIIATGLRGITFRSQDRGETWQEIDPQVAYSTSSVSIEGDAVLLTGAGGTIAYSADKGDTFKNFTQRGRVSLSQGIFIADQQFLLVGQGGVHHFEISPANQE